MTKKITKKGDFENLNKLHGILAGKAGEEFEKNILKIRSAEKGSD
jgi:hypothetical protein